MKKHTALGMGMEQIKRWAIIAFASDDLLVETLVLKGGIAIDLLPFRGNKKLSRASYDLDFSIQEDFEDLEEIKARIEKTMNITFAEHGLVVFDYQFLLRPQKVQNNTTNEKDFWGGYSVEFKLIGVDEYRRLSGDLERMRRQAVVTNPNHSSRVEIQISKYEYIGDRMTMEIEGYNIYMYSPQMIVFEKLRAICQQMPEYAGIVPSHSPRPRARDFYDIHLICQQSTIDFSAPASQTLLQLIFDAKKVPVSYISKIKEHADIHRQDL